MTNTPAVLVPREPVDSSALKAIGYDADRRILAVEFKTGAIRHHLDVDPGTWERMADASSIGSFYAHHIKGRYTSELMTGRCPKCGDNHGPLFTRCVHCREANYEREARRGTYDESEADRAETTGGE